MTKQKPLANPWLATRKRTGAEYDAPYEARVAAGINVHGEADFVSGLLKKNAPQTAIETYSVLDGGCGTGRISIELAHRGFSTVGVDLDEVMLMQARAKAPHLDWRLDDLASIEINQHFDCVLLAGNVMIYLTPGTEAATLNNMSRHLKTGGILIAAFELPAPSWSNMALEVYDRLAVEAGLTLIERWSTWDKDIWHPDDKYAVSVHRK